MRFFYLVILIFGQAANAQQQNIKVLFAEAGKNGLVFNVLYDHHFIKKKLGVHAGGGTTLINTNFELRTATIGACKLIGKKSTYLEIGFDLQYHFADEYADDVKGGTFVFPVKTYEGVFHFAIIGFRRYREKTAFRVGFAPGIVDKGFMPGAYIGFGSILNRK